MEKERRTRWRGVVRTGTAKASATKVCGLSVAERIRATVMIEDMHTLNACILWVFGYSTRLVSPLYECWSCSDHFESFESFSIFLCSSPSPCPFPLDVIANVPHMLSAVDVAQTRSQSRYVVDLVGAAELPAVEA